MHLLSKYEALDFIARRANLLDDPANPVNPFGTSAWILHFIDQVATKEWTIVIPEAVREGKALMLLCQRTRSAKNCSALSNYYASLFSPLVCASAQRANAANELVRQLTDLRPRRSTIDLAPLDRHGSDTTWVSNGFRSYGWYVRQYACFGNWYLPCAGVSFDAYMETRDSQLRNTWKRKSKKLLAAGRIDVITDISDVEAGMDAYDAVYAKSWKRPEPYPNFVRGWARICAERGWLRLGIATVADKPVAVQFWIAYGSRAYIFKLAYDEGESQWSAGTVLTAHMIRHALEIDRVFEIDYLTGDDEYKKTWMTHRRERVGLKACNLRSLQGSSAAAVEFGGHWRGRLRDWMTERLVRPAPAGR